VALAHSVKSELCSVCRKVEAGHAWIRMVNKIDTLLQRTDAECGPSFIDIYRKDRWTLASSVTE
jgi:hypothetical protein